MSRRKAAAAHDDTIITLEAAQAQYQHKQYDLCLLTLHVLTDAAGTNAPEAQALTAICKIHKHAAVQDWHKVKLLSLGCCQPEPLKDMTSSRILQFFIMSSLSLNSRRHLLPFEHAHFTL